MMPQLLLVIILVGKCAREFTLVFLGGYKLENAQNISLNACNSLKSKHCASEILVILCSPLLQISR